MFVLMESSPISIHYKAFERYFLGKMKTFMLIIIKLPHDSLLFWLGFFPHLKNPGPSVMILLLIPVTLRPKEELNV